MKKFLRLLACILVVASFFCITTYAFDTVRVDVVELLGTEVAGIGLLKCTGPADYVTYTETEAFAAGTDDDDFVFVYLIYNEYNPELSREIEKWNDGPNYIAAWIRDQGYNPDQVSSQHGIWRSGVYYWGEAEIDYS